VITQLTRTELLPIIEQLGLGETVTPHETVARTLVDAIEQRDQVSTVGILKNELRLMLVKVPERLGRTAFQKLDLPDGTSAVARIRGEEEVRITPETEILPEDRLLLLVTSDGHDTILDRFADKRTAGK
jgi:trk system potassium uptake protein TrkA